MLYIPDAYIYCMEDSGPQPVRMSIKKMHRWFGNMLRNNGRVIRLGMGAQKPFVWWCHVDQRLSMWTSLMGPIAAIWASIWLSPLLFANLRDLGHSCSDIVHLATYARRAPPLAHGYPHAALLPNGLAVPSRFTRSFTCITKNGNSHRQDADGGETVAGEPFLDFLIPKLQIAFSCTVLLLLIISIVGYKGLKRAGK